MAISLKELEAKLAEVEGNPRGYFGEDIDNALKELLKVSHPDHFHNGEEVRAEVIFKRFTALAEEARTPAVVIETKTGKYTVERRLGVGDVSDVYLAANESGDHYVIKVSRIVGSEKLLMHENFVLQELIEASKGDSYQYYFPQPIESVKGKSDINVRVNVFTYEPGNFTLEQVKDKHPHGLDGVHLAWLFKRLLTGLGFAHAKNWVHNAILPPHIMVTPATHGAIIIDWKTAGAIGPVKLVSAKYRDWYPPEVSKKQDTGPSSDIYMAAKCMIYLAGGDPVRGIVPASVPRPMAGFFRSCLLESPKQRPQDAWALHDEFSKMLKTLYGKPTFHHLVMN